ncbi:CBS domain-containing protein [Streptomyces phaeochromogenes]
MSDFERHASGTEARRTTPGRPWAPAEGQRQDALQRYLGAVAAAAATKADESVPGPEEAVPSAPVHEAPAHEPAPLRVRDVMSVPATSVTGDTPFLDVAHTLAHEQVSAVPVVDTDDHVIGVVSESDLLAKAAVMAKPHRHGALGRLRQHHLYEKSRGETAATLMTFPPVTVRPGDLVTDAAWTAAHGRLKRLPVTDGQGRLVGVVSRVDLLRALIRDDAEIRAEVESVIRHQFLLDPAAFDVTVEHGVVALAGRGDAATVPKLLEAVRGIEDVVGVVDRLGVD